MPSYGLLPEGFVPKPQTVIKEELDTVYKNTFGAQLGSEPDGSIPADSVAERWTSCVLSLAPRETRSGELPERWH